MDIDLIKKISLKIHSIARKIKECEFSGMQAKAEDYKTQLNIQIDKLNQENDTEKS